MRAWAAAEDMATAVAQRATAEALAAARREEGESADGSTPPRRPHGRQGPRAVTLSLCRSTAEVHGLVVAL